MMKPLLIKKAKLFRSTEEIIEDIDKKCDAVLKKIKIMKIVKSRN
jgi:hypothetical protein